MEPGQSYSDKVIEHYFKILNTCSMKLQAIDSERPKVGFIDPTMFGFVRSVRSQLLGSQFVDDQRKAFVQDYGFNPDILAIAVQQKA